jgi:hypothetical protein
MEPKQMKHLSDTALESRLLALPKNIRLGWQYLPRDKRSSLLRKFVNYGQKKFYNIGTWMYRLESENMSGIDPRTGRRPFAPWPSTKSLRALAITQKS